jgi:hypothetical protein
MAIAKLIIEDLNVETGEVKWHTEIEGAPSVDDGQMTAAQVMAALIAAEIGKPEFRDKMWAAVEQMVKDSGATIANPDFHPSRKAS